MASNHVITPLAIRLKQAVVAAGGTRALSQHTGISEAQLNRYYNGQPVPSDKLIALATACNVTVPWLFEETLPSAKKLK